MQCLAYPFIFFALLKQYEGEPFGCSIQPDEDDCTGGLPRYCIPIIIAVVLAIREWFRNIIDWWLNTVFSYNCIWQFEGATKGQIELVLPCSVYSNGFPVFHTLDLCRGQRSCWFVDGIGCVLEDWLGHNGAHVPRLGELYRWLCCRLKLGTNWQGAHCGNIFTTIWHVRVYILKVAACFGSPLLNLLVGVGLGCTLAILTVDEHSNGVVLELDELSLCLAGGLGIMLVSLLFILPITNFKAGRVLGIYQIVFYCVNLGLCIYFGAF